MSLDTEHERINELADRIVRLEKENKSLKATIRAILDALHLHFGFLVDE